MKSFFNKLKSNTSENRSFVSGASVYFLFNLLSAALQFATIPIFARLMSPEGFGLFGACIAVAAMFSPLIAFGTKNFVGLPIYKGDSARNHLTTSVQFIFISFFAHSILLMAIPNGLISNLEVPRSALWIGLFIVFSQAIIYIYSGVELARKNYSRSAIIGFSTIVLSTSLSFLGLKITNHIWVGRLYGMFLAQNIVMLYAIYSLKNFYRCKFLELDKKTVRMLFSYSIPLVPHLVAETAMGNIDRVLIFSKSGAHDAGIYTAALTLSTALEICFVSFNSALMPHIASEVNSADQIEAKKRLRLVTTLLGVSIIVVSFVAGICFANFSSLIFGSKYTEVANLAAPLSVASAIGGFYYLFINYLFLFEKTGLISLVTMSSAAIKIILLCVLVPKHGVYGAVLATILTNLFVAFWLAVASQKIYPIFRIPGKNLS